MTSRGQPTVDRILPGLEFRTRHSGTPPRPKGGRTVLYAWVETPGLPPVRPLFSELDGALGVPGAAPKILDLRKGQQFYMLDTVKE